MCPHLIVQHVATYRNGEAEAGYWARSIPGRTRSAWTHTAANHSRSSLYLKRWCPRAS